MNVLRAAFSGISFGVLVMAGGPVVADSALAAEARIIPHERHQVVVYYANETTAQAAQSGNYRLLLSALQRSSSPDAKPIADALKEDAKEFPALVEHQVERLLMVAKRRQFDLVVFTNALALDRNFLVYKAATGAVEIKTLPARPPAPSPALATAPLARPGYLRAALMQVGTLFPSNSIDIVLITISHGAGDLALTPRVFADLSLANATNLVAELSRPVPDAGGPPLWAAYPGTTKVEYWRALSEAARRYGMRFPLVIREACESGVSSLRELLALPHSVGAVAHTGHALIIFSDLDDASLFDVDGGNADRLQHASQVLAKSGLHVDRRPALWLELMETMFWRWYGYLFFLPMALWLAWQASAALPLRRSFGALSDKRRPSGSRWTET
jgi:hypothetical protein